MSASYSSKECKLKLSMVQNGQKKLQRKKSILQKSRIRFYCLEISQHLKLEIRDFKWHSLQVFSSIKAIQLLAYYLTSKPLRSSVNNKKLIQKIDEKMKINEQSQQSKLSRDEKTKNNVELLMAPKQSRLIHF